MSIRIVTDSTCDLPARTIAEYGITVVPLHISIGNKGYLDDVKMTREEFYKNLESHDPVPKTAVSSPEQHRLVYESLAAQGATEILSIHVSTSLSAARDAAQLGANEMKSIPITVMDSRQISLGTGFLVETAARMAMRGASMGEILAAVQDQIRRTYVFAALDTVEFLKRSGKLNELVASIGTILQVKPLLRMYDGKLTLERVRTREAAIERLLELLYDVGWLQRVAIVHTHALDRVAEIREKAAHILPPDDILSVDVTPVIGAHIGPGAVGFACVAAR